MGRFVRGDVVVLPFPFSDLTQAKRRPALVVASLDGQDAILCQITSQTVNDRYAIELAETDFSEGSLRKPSNIRPNRIFTAHEGLVLYRAGALKPEKRSEVCEALIRILRE